jgi:hypothetical protein
MPMPGDALIPCQNCDAGRMSRDTCTSFTAILIRAESTSRAEKMMRAKDVRFTCSLLA